MDKAKHGHIARVFTAFWVICGTGCSSSDVAISGDAGTDTGTTDGGDSTPDVFDGSAGPSLFFHVRASTSPVPHADGLAGQTSRNTKQGIRSLRLLRNATDTTPVIAFDHGKGFVEAGYDDKNDTVVGSTSVSRLPAGRYTVAQIVVTHSRFRVNSTLHYMGTPIPGEFDCVQALSNNVTLPGDSVERASGWYRYVFEAAGNKFPQEGTSAPLPSSPTTGGFTLKTVAGETFYEVSVDMFVDPTLRKDLQVMIDINMHESFRWEDQDLPGYTKGVFDTIPTGFEPVRRFGANGLALSLE